MDQNFRHRLQEFSANTDIPQAFLPYLMTCFAESSSYKVASQFLLGPLKAAITYKVEDDATQVKLVEMATECFRILTSSSTFENALKINRNCYHFFSQTLGFSKPSEITISQVSTLQVSANLLTEFCNFLSAILNQETKLEKEFLTEFSTVADNLSRLSWNLAIVLNTTGYSSSDVTFAIFLASFRLRTLSPACNLKHLAGRCANVYQYYKNFPDKLYQIFTTVFQNLLDSLVCFKGHLQIHVPIFGILEFALSWVELCFRYPEQRTTELYITVIDCSDAFFKKLPMDDGRDLAQTIWDIIKASVRIPSKTAAKQDLKPKDVKRWTLLLEAQSNSLGHVENDILHRMACFVSKWMVILSNAMNPKEKNCQNYHEPFVLLPLVGWALNVFEGVVVQGSNTAVEAAVSLFRGYSFCIYFYIKECKGSISHKTIAEISQFYLTQLQVNLIPQEKKIEEVRTILASLVISIAEKKFPEVVPLLDFLVFLIAKYVKESRMTDEENSIGKTYGHLVLCYHHFEMYSQAVNAMAELLPLLQGSVQNELLRRWIYLKGIICAALPQASYARRHAVEHLRSMKHVVEKAETLQLLRAELAAYRLHGPGMEEETLKASRDFIHLSQNQDYHRALAAIDLCKVARIMAWKAEQNLEELCESAVETLENTTVDEDTFESPARKLYLSFGYYELFLLKSKKLKELIKASGVSRVKSVWIKPVPKGDEEPDQSCDIQASLRHVTLVSGTDCLLFLDKALLALQEATKASRHSPDVVLTKTFGDLKTILGHPLVLAESFLVARRVEQSLSCFIQLYHLGESLKNMDVQCQAICGSVSILARAGLASHALLLKTSMKPGCPSLALQCQLATAQAQFYAGQYEPGMECLLSLLAELSSHQESGSARSRLKMVEVEALYLLVRYLMLATPSLPLLSSKFMSRQKAIPEKLVAMLRQPPTFVVLAAFRLCISVYKIHHGSQGCNTSDTVWRDSYIKPYLQRLLMEGALLVGELYIHQGEVLEPQQVLLDYLAVAQEQAAMIWSADLLVKLAELDLVSNNLDDCIVKCQGIIYLINSEQVESTNDQPQKQLNPVLNSSFAEEDKDIESYQLVEPSADFRQQSVSSSPVKTLIPQMRKAKFHDVKCTCDTCKYECTDMFVLSAMQFQAECSARSNSFETCFNELSEVNKIIPNFRSKTMLRLQRLSHLGNSLLLSLNIKQRPSKPHQDLKTAEFLFQTNIRIAECLMQMNNPRKALLFLDESLTVIEKAPDLSIKLPSIYASLIFQRCLAKLQIFAFEKGQLFVSLFNTCSPSISEEESCSLMLQFSQLSLDGSEENTPQSFPLTPTKTEFVSAPKAPVKKGKTISFTDSCKKPTSANLKPPEKVDSDVLNQASTKIKVSKNNAFIESPAVLPESSLKKENGLSVKRKATRPKATTTTNECCNNNNNKFATKVTKMEDCILDASVTPKSDKGDVLRSVGNTEFSNKEAVESVLNHKNGKVKATMLKDLVIPIVETKVTSEDNDCAAVSGKRTLRPRTKVQSGANFEVLKSARRAREKRKEQRENIEVEFERSCIDDSPETMRTGRRNVRTIRSKNSNADIDKEVEVSRNVLDTESYNLVLNKDLTHNAKDNPHVDVNVASQNVSESLETFLDPLAKELAQAVSAISHNPPSLLFAPINLLLAMLQNSLPSQDCKLSAAYHLSQSVGVTLRHQSLLSLERRKIVNFENPEYTQKVMNLQSVDRKRQKILNFQCLDEKSIPEVIQRNVDAIPEDWTVVQVSGARVWHSLSSVKTSKTPDLMLGRYSAKSSPVVALISTTDPQLKKSFLKEFQDIMETVVINGKEQQPRLWWAHRYALDKRLKALCMAMEKVWLGCWKCLFLGKPMSNVYAERLSAAVSQFIQKTQKLGFKCRDQEMVKCLLDGVASNLLEPNQLYSGLCYLFGLNVCDLGPLMKLLKDLHLDGWPTTQRKPLVLILDKMVHPLPWENMSFLQGSPVSRMPSLAFLLSQVTFHANPCTDSVYLKGINASNTFYIINPSKDLARTEEFFKDKLPSVPGWSGLTSTVPTKEQMLSAVMNHDCYLYIGHGTGRVYFRKETLTSYPCRAAVILMGCSSAKLKAIGRTEPTGTPFQYLMGGCPAVLGNLWDVTDKDIDKFTDVLVNKWLLGESGTQLDLAFQEGRSACKLPHLTGAAPIVYGLPLYKK